MSESRIPALVSLWIAILPGLVYGQSGDRPAGATPASDRPAGEHPSDGVAAGDSSAPWQRSVSPEDQRAARDLFAEARKLHRDLLREEAVATYREALRYWDHPNIHFNLTRILLDMGWYLEAYQHSERALAWGREALGEDRDAMDAMRRRLLAYHLAVVEVRCDQPGAQVALDGTVWFVGPGREQKVVAPGNHMVTAESPGHFPAVRALTIVGGRQARIVLHMASDAIVAERRWRAWKPWGVIGAGVATGLVGGGLLWQASRDFSQEDRRLAGECGVTAACPPGDERGYRRARRERGIGVGVLAAAGLTIAGGVGLAVLNRPRVRREEKERSRATYELLPVVTGDGAGLSINGWF